MSVFPSSGRSQTAVAARPRAARNAAFVWPDRPGPPATIAPQ
jgi:hypothetical protein